MNIIAEIKNDIKNLLITRCNVQAEQVHFLAVDEYKGIHARAYPVLGLIVADEEFKNDWTADVRGVRIIPLEVRIWHKNVDKAELLADTLLEVLPTQWQYKGMSGEIEVERVVHSDHIAQVTKEYAVFVVIKHSIQIKKSSYKEKII